MKPAGLSPAGGGYSKASTGPVSSKVTPTTGQLMKGAQTRALGEAVTMDLHNAGIEEIAGLDACPKLRSVDLSFNKIAELKNLDTLTELRELKLYDNRLILVKGLLQLTSLQTLDLSGNRIEYIEGVSHLKQLTTLRLAHNKIQELKGVGKMSGLQILDASNNKISQMDGLQGCTALKELNLNSNKISTIGGLSRCSQLTELALNDNKLTSLKGLRDIAPTVDILWVAENQLESLRGMPESLPRLSELYLADNKLTSLQPLDKCCPSLELLDVVRNKLSSVKRLAAALAPLPDLAELKAEGNPICHQPEEQEPYRVRVLTALPLLRYLDDEEVTEAERMWIKCGGNTPQLDDPQALELMPTQEEMEEFKQKMGIRSAVPVMGTPSTSRPQSAQRRSFSRQGSLSGSRPGSATGSRPGTASLPEGTAPVGPLGRPSTPRAQGQAVVPVAVAGGNPLLTQRPLSARSATGAALMKPEEYETSLTQFTETMDEYRVQMESVVSQLRAGLAMNLPEATAAVRAGGMQGAEGIATAVLPKPPQLPTFATRSDTDAALKREARAQAAAKKQRQDSAEDANGSSGSGFSRGAVRPQSPATTQPQRLPSVPQGVAARLHVPGVSDSINAMPDKSSLLLQQFNALFPAEKRPASSGHQDEQVSGTSHAEVLTVQYHTEPAQSPTKGRKGTRGYKAAGGFTRIDMDDLDPPQAARPAYGAVGGFTRVDMDEGQPSTARVDPTRPAMSHHTDGEAAADLATGKSSLMAQLNALEAMVEGYGEVGSMAMDTGVRESGGADDRRENRSTFQQHEQETSVQEDYLAYQHPRRNYGPDSEEPYGVHTQPSVSEPYGREFDNAPSPAGPDFGHGHTNAAAAVGGAEGAGKYSKFKLPTNASNKVARAGGVAAGAAHSKPAARLGATAVKLHSPRGPAPPAGPNTTPDQPAPGSKAVRPTSGRLEKRAAGGMLARRG